MYPASPEHLLCALPPLNIWVPHLVLSTGKTSGYTPTLIPGELTGGPGGPGGPVSPRGPRDPCREKSLGNKLCLWRPLPANTCMYAHTHRALGQGHATFSTKNKAHIFLPCFNTSEISNLTSLASHNSLAELFSSIAVYKIMVYLTTDGGLDLMKYNGTC